MKRRQAVTFDNNQEKATAGRKTLLGELERYALRHPQESECAAKFSVFLRTNPGCFERSLTVGHVTGSCWLVNTSGSHCLLTHHKKLGVWLQPGGHADGEPDILGVALREACEESGISQLAAVSSEIFDIDIHRIPAGKSTPAHLHYDLRYALRAGTQSFSVSEESHDLAWVRIDPVTGLSELRSYSSDASLMRMGEKWLGYPGDKSDGADASSPAT